jgi:hypothetical protein
MTTSEKLNFLVTEMASKKGYAYTTGFLQSLLQSTSYGLTNKNRSLLEGDIDAAIRTLSIEGISNRTSSIEGTV